MYEFPDKENQLQFSSTLQLSHSTQQQHLTRQTIKQMSKHNTITDKSSTIHNTRSHSYLPYEYINTNEEHTLSGKKRVRSNNNSIDTNTNQKSLLSQTINLAQYHTQQHKPHTRSTDNSKRARALTPEPISITASTVKHDIDSDCITSDCSIHSSGSSSRYDENVWSHSSASKQSTTSLTCLEPSEDNVSGEKHYVSRTSSQASVDTQLLSNIKNQYITAPVTRSKSHIQHATVTQQNNNKAVMHDSTNTVVSNNDAKNATTTQPQRTSSEIIRSNTVTTRSRSAISTVCSVETIMLDLDPLQLEQMFTSEKKYQPSKDYFSWQQYLEPSMRPILYDWLMEVSQEFHLGRETYHLACNYVDRFLSHTVCTPVTEQQKQIQRTTRRTVKPGNIDDPNCTITRSNLQLLGVTCLSIAAKFEEIYPPSNSDFATTTDGAYTIQQIDSMERTVLKKLHWSLHSVTTYTWLKMLIKAVTQRLALDYQIKYQTLKSSNNNKQTAQLLRAIELHVNDITHVLISTDMFERCMILLDLASLDTHFLEYYPSAIAMSAFLLIYVQHYNYYSNQTLFQHMSADIKAQWFTYSLADYVSELTGYSITVLQQCIQRLNEYTKLALIDAKQYPQRRHVTDQHLEELKIPKNELYGRQIHYTQGLQLVQHTQQKYNTAHTITTTPNGVAEQYSASI